MSKIPSIRDWTHGMVKANKGEDMKKRKPSAYQEHELPDEKQRSIEFVGVQRQRVDWVGEQTGDGMFMFAICNLRSTIHFADARNSILSTTSW